MHMSTPVTTSFSPSLSSAASRAHHFVFVNNIPNTLSPSCPQLYPTNAFIMKIDSDTNSSKEPSKPVANGKPLTLGRHRVELPAKKVAATKPAPGKTPATKSTTKAVATKPAPAGKAIAAPAKKDATKKAAAKADPKTTAKTASKKAPSTTTSKAAPKPVSKKRKASQTEEDDEESEGSASDRSAKRARTEEPKKKSTPKPKAAPKPRKVAAPKAPKPKVVINTPPTKRQDVYVFGDGSAGELGFGAAKKATDVKRPRLNTKLLADTVGVVTLAVGGMHVVALTHDNKLLTWGVNDQGALGRDTTWDGGLRDMDADKSDAEDSDDDDPGLELNPRESTPTEVLSSYFPAGTTFVHVAAGDSSSFALTDEGLVYGWGTFRVSSIPIHSSYLSQVLTIAG